MHSNLLKLYQILLEMVSLAKELEFHIKMEHNITDPEIIRSFMKKELPHKGFFYRSGESWTWHIHGDGITFLCGQTRFHYEVYPKNNYGFTFNAKSVNDYIRTFGSIDQFEIQIIEEMFTALCEKMLLVKVWPIHEVYALI